MLCLLRLCVLLCERVFSQTMQIGFPDELAINNNSVSHCSLNSHLLSPSALLLIIFFCPVMDNKNFKINIGKNKTLKI